jgi:hypothetical protein
MNHAGRRSLSRYGVEMTWDEQIEIAGHIEAGQGKKIRRGYSSSAKGAELWIVHWARLGRDVPVIYLRNVESIATVLPECVLTRRLRYRELDVDWIDGDQEEAIDTDALADVLVNALRGEVQNDVLAIKLREAGVAR